MDFGKYRDLGPALGRPGMPLVQSSDPRGARWSGEFARAPGSSRRSSGDPSGGAAGYSALLVVLAAGFLVFRGALPYFFSADDFAWLAQAQGVMAPAEHFSRWIASRLFWKVWLGMFGLDPMPYHAASLAAFLAASAMLFLLLRRRAGLAVAAYVASDVAGLRSGSSPAYAIGIGGHVGRNLLTCCGWALNFLAPTVKSFSDAVDPQVYGWGAGALVIGAAGLVVPALRRGACCSRSTASCWWARSSASRSRSRACDRTRWWIAR